MHWNRPERCVATVDRFRDQGVPVRDHRRRQRLAAVAAGARIALPDDVEVIELGANRGFGPAANAGFRRWLERAPQGLAATGSRSRPTTRCRRPVASPACWTSSPSGPAPGWRAPTTATAPRRWSTRTSAASSRPPPSTEGWEPAGHPHGTLLHGPGRLPRATIGLFDERYFAYCEEADLGLRARAAGWEVGLVRGAMVRNPDLGSAVAAIDYLQLRNTLLLVREHSGRYHASIRFLLAAGPTRRRRRGAFPPRPLLVGRRAAAGAGGLQRGRFGPPAARLFVHT